jgi:hypothetical protein
MQLLCLGDVALAQSFLSDAVWAAPGGLMTGVETQVMFNWEFPLGEKVNSQPRESGRRFMAQPESIKRITNWAPGIATMATNHILDAGEEGLAGSIHALQKAGFRTVGAGIAPKEIAAPITWETAEGRLSIINWVFKPPTDGGLTHHIWARSKANHSGIEAQLRLGHSGRTLER